MSIEQIKAAFVIPSPSSYDFTLNQFPLMIQAYFEKA
jgi:hypothetical protein